MVKYNVRSVFCGYTRCGNESRTKNGFVTQDYTLQYIINEQKNKKYRKEVISILLRILMKHKVSIPDWIMAVFIEPDIDTSGYRIDKRQLSSECVACNSCSQIDSKLIESDLCTLLTEPKGTENELERRAKLINSNLDPPKKDKQKRGFGLLTQSNVRIRSPSTSQV